MVAAARARRADAASECVCGGCGPCFLLHLRHHLLYLSLIYIATCRRQQKRAAEGPSTFLSSASSFAASGLQCRTKTQSSHSITQSSCGGEETEKTEQCCLFVGVKGDQQREKWKFRRPLSYRGVRKASPDREREGGIEGRDERWLWRSAIRTALHAARTCSCGLASLPASHARRPSSPWNRRHGSKSSPPTSVLPPRKKNVRRLPPADTRHVRGRDKAGGTRRRPAIEPPASLPTTACCCLPCTVVPLDDASDHKQRPRRERYGTHTAGGGNREGRWEGGSGNTMKTITLVKYERGKNQQQQNICSNRGLIERNGHGGRLIGGEWRGDVEEHDHTWILTFIC